MSVEIRASARTEKFHRAYGEYEPDEYITRFYVDIVVGTQRFRATCGSAKQAAEVARAAADELGINEVKTEGL